MKAEVPKISCICVTRAKPELLARAIRCFLEQSYPNKEMLLLYEDDDTATVEFLQKTSLPESVRFLSIGVSPKRTLGELRNLAIAASNGELICQWDDDDWYHARRLAYQWHIMRVTGFGGCVMTRWMMYDMLHKKAYYSDLRFWEGSLLCKRELFSLYRYENLDQGEDTPLVEALYQHRHLFPFDVRPNLYVYIYHAGNTCTGEHWTHLFSKATELPKQVSAKVEGILSGRHTGAAASVLLDELLGIPSFSTEANVV